jgi:hypothetical protein
MFPWPVTSTRVLYCAVVEYRSFPTVKSVSPEMTVPAGQTKGASAGGRSAGGRAWTVWITSGAAAVGGGTGCSVAVVGTGAGVGFGAGVAVGRTTAREALTFGAWVPVVAAKSR